MSAATLPLITLAELSSRGPSVELIERAKLLMTRALFSEKILTGSVAAYYIRKAIRTGAWRRLSPESRALLLALKGWRRQVKSPLLKRILTRIFVEIDLYTTRGKAIFYGIMEAMVKAQNLLKNPVENLPRIIILGIQYINLPLIYRVHG